MGIALIIDLLAEDGLLGHLTSELAADGPLFELCERTTPTPAPPILLEGWRSFVNHRAEPRSRPESDRPGF
jgi:hypothetical protein